MEQFQNDLKKGKKAEEYVCNFLRQFFADAKVFDGYKKEWDIEVPSRDTTIEVKYDRLSKNTGNVAIEMQYYSSPSGIMATTAQVWCIIFSDGKNWFFGFVYVEKLKEACTDKRIVWGGDDKAAKMALLPVSELMNICKYYPVEQ